MNNVNGYHMWHPTITQWLPVQSGAAETVAFGVYCFNDRVVSVDDDADYYVDGHDITVSVIDTINLGRELVYVWACFDYNVSELRIVANGGDHPMKLDNHTHWIPIHLTSVMIIDNDHILIDAIVCQLLLRVNLARFCVQ